MKRILSSLLLCLPAANAFADEGAIAAAKTHLTALLTSDFATMEKTYAEKVILMPGHELLKPEYGFTDQPDRKTATEAAGPDLAKAFQKASAKQDPRPPEKIRTMIDSLKFEVLENGPGDLATEASDPVKTPDGKLHFAIRDGDVLVKASPERGDFALFQLRQVDGAWRVVAEYLD
jgi:hypothetical protein